jgi:ABC-2 type transport system permease protein
MLWYKAWLETKSRFLIALIGITLICSYVVLHSDRNTYPFTTASWYNGALNFGHSILVLTWIVAVTLLAMGGLLREKASGASTFTLALPVGRTRLIAVRITVGLLQSILLGVVPWIGMYFVDRVFGRTHSVSQAVFRVVLILSGGLICFSLAILVSSLVEGEYTAPVVGLGAIAVTAIVFSDPPYRAYNPWVFMTGSEYLQKSTMLLAGPIPWLHVAANLVVAAVLLLLAIRSIRKRDLT